jgi:flagellar biosynthesis/type III secretory pathway protein FliH
MDFKLFFENLAAKISESITTKTNKGVQMDVFAAFESLKALIAELTLKLVDTEAAIAEAKKAAYDEGFAAGVASVPTPGGEEKIYSQVELDAKVAEAVAAMEMQLADATAKIAELEAKVGEIDAKVAEALAAFKAELKAKYEEQQVAESASETGFAALLS